MKSAIIKFVTLSLAVLAGLGTQLASRGLISAADVPEINRIGAELASTIALLVAGIGYPFLERLRAKYFPQVGNSVGSSGTSGGIVPLLLMGTAAAIMTGLPSCSNASSFPISGSIRYRDPNTGAKAVIVIGDPAKPRVDLFNGTTGTPLGRTSAPVDLTSGK